MERLLIESSVRAALLVAGTAFVLYVMRVKAAAARHGVWAAVVLLMLLLPIWAAWGPKAPLRVLPPLPQRTASDVIVSGTLSNTFLSSPLVSAWQAVLLGIYLSGLCILLLRLTVGTLRARALVRHAVLHDGIHISRQCAAPVTVGLLHPTVILPDHWQQWPEAQLAAILTHEREHARRRDSLIQSFALLNRAVFWFHPIAWWLERHLSALAEEACDNVVLARGHKPREYSEYLIDLARSVMRSGARLNITGMSMPGSFLQKRIRQILDNDPVPRMSRTRMVFVAVMCMATCTVFAAGTLVHAGQGAPGRLAKNYEEPEYARILTPHEGVDFRPFMSHLLVAIKTKWYANMPTDAKKDKGKVVVRFKIERDGAVLDEGPTIETSSGTKSLDDAVVAAIRASAPFEHLPETFNGPSIELRLMFSYNP